MNTIYDVARYRFATSQLNWTTINLRMLIFSGTSDFVATDTKVSDLTTRAKSVLVGESAAIATKTVNPAGYLQTDHVLIPSVPTGAQITSFIFIIRGADVPNSVPVLFIDEAEGLPFTPNGLDVIIQPDWLQQRGWARV